MRNIADEIEAGDYGEVGCIGVVILGDTVEVFGGSVDSTGSSVATLLYAGFLRPATTLERHGR